MSTEKNKALVRKSFAEGPSKGNLSASDELLSPDFVIHSDAVPVTPGIEGMKEIITSVSIPK